MSAVTVATMRADRRVTDLKRLLEEARLPWCVHPNGTSAWTGAEYDSNDMAQVMMFRARDGVSEESLAIMDAIVETMNTAPALIAELEAARERIAELDRSNVLLTLVAGALDVRSYAHVDGREPITAAASAARHTLVEACRAVGLPVKTANEQSESIPKLVEAIQKLRDGASS